MADDLVVREALGRLAPDLIQSVLESPDPDASIRGVADYLRARTGRAMFLDYLRDDPRALHVLTHLMGTSPVLAEILIRTPEYFHWLVPQVERSVPDREAHEEELVSALFTLGDSTEALDMLRRWKRRETLRIGTRDLLRRDALPAVTAQLSDVACVAIDFALAIVMRRLLDEAALDAAPGTIAVIATGLLGAGELGYGSDVELLYVFDTQPGTDVDAEAARAFFVKAGHELNAALGEETREGVLYNVRPVHWPQVACPLHEYLTHYEASRDVAERRALTRARAVAGDAELGHRFLTGSEPFVYGEPVAEVAEPPSDDPAVDIDRFTQWLQLRRGAAHAVIRRVGTRRSLEAAARLGAIDETVHRELDHAYVILRSAQHRIQLGVDENLEKQLALSRHRVREICQEALQQELRRPPDRR